MVCKVLHPVSWTFTNKTIWIQHFAGIALFEEALVGFLSWLAKWRWCTTNPHNPFLALAIA